MHDFKQSLLEAYAVNERLGQTIAAMAAHMHNVRLMWLAVAAKGKPPNAAPGSWPKRPNNPKAKLRASARTWWGCSAICSRTTPSLCSGCGSGARGGRNVDLAVNWSK